MFFTGDCTIIVLNDSLSSLNYNITPMDGYRIGFIKYTGASWAALIPLSINELLNYDVNSTSYDVAGVASGVPTSVGIWQNCLSVTGEHINESNSNKGVIVAIKFTKK